MMTDTLSLDKIKSLVIPILSGVLSIGFVPISNLILLPLYTILLSIEDFALYGLIMYYVSNITAVVNPGIMSVVRREFNNQDLSIARTTFVIVFKYFLLAGLVASIFGIILIFFSVNNNITSKYFFCIFLLGISIQPVKLWQGYEASINIENVKWTAVLSFILILVSSIVTVVLLFSSFDKVLGRLFPIVFINFILLLVSIVRTKDLPWKSFDMLVATKIWTLSKKYAFTIVSSHMYIFFPIYYINNYLGLNDLGIFTLGIYIVNIPNILVEGLNFYWAPQYYRIKNSGVHYPIRNKLLVFTSLMMVLYLCLTVIINLFHSINDNILAILPVINVLVVFAFLSSVIKIITPLLNYRVDYNFQSRINFTAVVVLIFLSLVLEPSLNEFLIMLCSSKLIVLLGYLIRLKSYNNSYES